MKIEMADGVSPDLQIISSDSLIIGGPRTEVFKEITPITSMINGEANNVARYSIGETLSMPRIKTDYALDLRSRREQAKEIAEALSHVPITDENLKDLYIRHINLVEITDDQAAHLTAIAEGKAIAAARESISTKEKEALNGWKKIIEKTGDILYKVGGEKALAKAGSLITLVATACGIAGPVAASRTPEQISTSTPQATEKYTPTEDPTATAKPTEVVITNTPEIDYSQFDMFNESTWPEIQQKFWDGGWLNSKEADRQDFQQFIEKVRTAFFAKEGMTDEVAKMTEIRPELRSLWGMIDYVETHKDEVIKNQTFIPVTPTELEWIMTDPSFSNNNLGEVHFWKGKIINQGTQYATYSMTATGRGLNFSSDIFGMPIAGKNGLVRVPRGPYREIDGDLAALGYVGGGESRVNLLLMNVLDKDGFHHLAAPAIPLGKDMIIPKGSPCPSTHDESVIILSKDLKIGQFQDYRGKIYTAEEVFKLLGKNMRIAFLARPPEETAARCLEPKSKDDIAYFDSVLTEGNQDNWAWSGEQP